MYNQRPTPRKDYLQQESLRIDASATLAETFRDLKALTVHLTYFTRGNYARQSEIKYTANLANAKSLFRFSCPNDKCVGGDFDLSVELAKAVAARQTTLTGEVICQGWRSQPEIGQAHCHNTLRYILSAEYTQDAVPA